MPSLLLRSLVLLLAFAPAAAAQPSYLLFEGGPVRPLALSPDGSRLFVANAPENHLEIFQVGPGGGLTPIGSVPVGVEPVAVAAPSNSEVWVVNHLSDSVSIVDVASSPPRVVRTLLVGDEPRDIVFAGNPLRAFISTAHRGQHRSHASIAAQPGAGDPQLTDPGVGRADVWVFDAASPGSAMGGVPVEIVTFFADTPRGLATDGSTVYVAAFHSGNQTTAIPETAVPNGFATSCVGSTPGGLGQGVPGPATSVDPDGAGPLPAPPAPETGLIVKFDGSDWVDALGCTWNDAVELELPDHDVFALDANTLAAGSIFDHVGTILFNMAVNPTTQKLYVTATESPNHIRFEGPGDHGGSTVQGRLSESRVSVLDPAGPSVDPQHLNQHIDYSMLHTDPGADHAAIDAQVPHSLATPLQILVDDGNQKVYVAAFGSAKVGVFDAAELEDVDFETNYDPTAQSADYIATGGGPAGLALAGSRLFVYTRFANRVEVYDVSGTPGPPLQTLALPTAEPDSVVEGRPFLYDAVATSGNGEASCSSCHIFGDFDSLGWNLGNPDDVTTANPQLIVGVPPGSGPDFHPMKGPMTTQTLRGLSTHSAMHWRGDRSNGFFNPSPPDCTQVSEDACDEEVSFKNFIVAFEGLVGQENHITGVDMQKFTDFALQLALPPNPVANLDGTLTTEPPAQEAPDQTEGEDVYFNHPSDGGVTCNFCHVLDPAMGFFGTDGQQSFEGEPQLFKVAHLRNAYQKIGMFGLVGASVDTGPQVRGFGFLHDGAIDTMFNFLEEGPFTLTPDQSRDLEQFMLAFPSDLAPVVGQQMSLGPGNPGSTVVGGDANLRVDLLDTRAGTGFDSFVLGGSVTECDLIAKTVEGGAVKGYLRQSNGSFLPDDGGGAISEAALRAKAEAPDSQDLLFTCAPPGSGQRMGIDRDLDGALDGLDNCPAWPNAGVSGTCTAGETALLAARCGADVDCGAGGACSLAQEDGDGDGTGDACEPALLPEPGSVWGWLCGAALAAALGRARRRR